MIGTALAVSGKRVLLVDNDPQYSLSSRTTLDKDHIEEGLDFYYSDKKKFIDILTPTYIENLFLAPAGFRLSDFYMRTDKKVVQKVDDLFDILRTDKSLTELFDYVLIDNPPSQNGVTMRCNLLSDVIVIPAIPDETCYEALVRSYMLIQEQAADFENKFIVIVPSIVNATRKQHNEVMRKIDEFYSGRNNNTIVANMIKNRAEIPDSIGYKHNLFVSHASSDVTQQLIELCLQVFPWIDKDEFRKSIKGYAETLRQERLDRFKEMIKIKVTKSKKELV